MLYLFGINCVQNHECHNLSFLNEIIGSFNTPQKVKKICHYPECFMQLKRQNKNDSQRQSKKFEYILRERGVEVVETIICAFKDFL